MVVDGADRYLDLTWPEAKIAVEYNGADHLDRRQYGDEMFRRHRLEDAGWRVRYVVWEDLIDPGRRHLLLEWLSQQLGQQGSTIQTVKVLAPSPSMHFDGLKSRTP